MEVKFSYPEVGSRKSEVNFLIRKSEVGSDFPYPEIGSRKSEAIFLIRKSEVGSRQGKNARKSEVGSRKSEFHATLLSIRMDSSPNG
ncbi:hypothetical protein CRE_30534 [Caenorhabditis remanei]|uniref:Uncharacterized protein n=1 Tax=Caenorhabditis remanei TaxID=31234 RepID=E3NKM8_CAERE|nr:hypothetical protein CRE_30534 [Caenorhabditis remanei]